MKEAHIVVSIFGYALIALAFLFAISWVITYHPFIGIPLLASIGVLLVIIGRAMKKRSYKEETK